MNPTALFVLGLTLLAATGVSVLRTARGRPSSLVSVAVRSLISARRMGRRLPVEHTSRRRGGVVGWAVLLVVPVVWGAGVVASTTLLAMSVDVAAMWHAAPVSVLGITSGGLNSLAFVVATCAGLVVVLAVSLAKARAALRARFRRDRFTQRLSEEARSCLEAEDVLATRLGGTPESVDRMMEAWRCWISDLDLSRRSRLELVALPSSSKLFWLDALLIVLDVAALADAVRPGTGRGARRLLATGCAYVQELAGRLGLTVVTTAPGLQGREERSFGVTLARLVYAGVRLERDCRTAEHVFYEWRRGYAPYVVTLADRLRPREAAAPTWDERRARLVSR